MTFFLALLKQERVGMDLSSRTGESGDLEVIKTKFATCYCFSLVFFFFSPTADKFFPNSRRNGCRIFQTHILPAQQQGREMCSPTDLIQNKSQDRSLIALPSCHWLCLSQAMTHCQIHPCVMRDRVLCCGWAALHHAPSPVAKAAGCDCRGKRAVTDMTDRRITTRQSVPPICDLLQSIIIKAIQAFISPYWLH